MLNLLWIINSVWSNILRLRNRNWYIYPNLHSFFLISTWLFCLFYLSLWIHNEELSLKLLLINHHCQKSLCKRVETSIPWHQTTKISGLCKRLSVSKTEITFVSGEALPHSAEGWPLQWPFQFFCGNTVDLTFIYLGIGMTRLIYTFPVKLFISFTFHT